MLIHTFKYAEHDSHTILRIWATLHLHFFKMLFQTCMSKKSTSKFNALTSQREISKKYNCVKINTLYIIAKTMFRPIATYAHAFVRTNSWPYSERCTPTLTCLPLCELAKFRFFCIDFAFLYMLICHFVEIDHFYPSIP
jgi:hypothetical protein